MKPDQQDKSLIVFLSTFPPRQCGIATFTADLADTVDRMFSPFIESKVVAMNVNDISHLPYSNRVIFQISQTNEKDYIDAALKLNELEKVKLINIQHEFGIFGGEYGSNLILFLEKIKKPVIVTFHTVLPTPDEKMLNVVRNIAKYSKGIVVMTQYSKELLEKNYGLNPNQIQIIPHGIHNVPYKTSQYAKSVLGFSTKLILSTFGLLSSTKGIEYVIEALPPVVKKFPNIQFIVAGVTHPVVLEQEGEKYRNFLINKVYELNLSKYVLFFNTYFNTNELLRILEATDIYLSPSLDPNQAVSGTLSYALGSGRPVISTAFAQAREDITDEVGMLVDFKNPQAFTNSITKLLNDNELRLKMGRSAYFRTRKMTWENVTLSYLKYFSKFVPGLGSEQRKLPPIKLTHLAKLTDNFGIIQFAKLTVPDISSGYTLDDNARALVAVIRYHNIFNIPALLKLASTYLNFICRVAKPDGYFDNYVDKYYVADEQRNREENLEDASARALYSLAQVSISKDVPKRFREKAHSVFENSFRKNVTFSAPRAIAFYIKGLYLLLSKWKEPKTLDKLVNQCEQLVNLYNKNHSSDWEWFEAVLTYSNAVLPEALLLGYKITGDKKYLNIAQITLKFLIKHSFKDNIYIPIGQSGWFPRGGERQYFDQQPEDVAATVEALNTMFQVTNENYYNELSYKAFNWFLGDNILGQVVYDWDTGGCYDGVGEKSINLNQGAESTISYLLARFSFVDQNPH
ncbi:MAG: glycosyltransferase [Candidatus Microgenomates bacterium]|jgi:glycosyltransferase involved in cell wall biosynthesis